MDKHRRAKLGLGAIPKRRRFRWPRDCVLFLIAGDYRPASSKTPEKLIPTPIRPTMKPTNVAPPPSWVRMSPRIPTETPDTATAVPRPTTSPRTLYELGKQEPVRAKTASTRSTSPVGMHPRAVLAHRWDFGSRVSVSQCSCCGDFRA